MRCNLKSIIVYLLICGFTMNVYAAVGGNDGSAFVTKAEFDALVNTFNNEMDGYEKSLVSKIDGAIANYLSSLSKERTRVLPSVLDHVDLDDRTFWNNSSYTDNIPNGSDFKCYTYTFACASFARYAYKDTEYRNYEGYVRVNSFGAEIASSEYQTNADNNNMWKVMYRAYDKDGTRYFSPEAGAKSMVIPIHRVAQDGTMVWRGEASIQAKLPTTTTWTTISNLRESGKENSEGMHIWGDFPSTRIGHGVEFTMGTNERNFMRWLPSTEYKTSVGKSYYGIIWKDRFTFDSDSMYDISLRANLAGVRVIQGKASTEEPVTIIRNTDTFNYKFYTQKLYNPNIYDWINYSASEAFGDAVYKINGIPLFTVNEECEVNIPLNITNSVGRSTVAIMASRFDKKAPSESKKSEYAYFNASADGSLDISINHTNDTETTYWLKICPNNPDATAIVELDGNIVQKITDK